MGIETMNTEEAQYRKDLRNQANNLAWFVQEIMESVGITSLLHFNYRLMLTVVDGGDHEVHLYSMFYVHSPKIYDWKTGTSPSIGCRLNFGSTYNHPYPIALTDKKDLLGFINDSKAIFRQLATYEDAPHMSLLKKLIASDAESIELVKELIEARGVK